MLLTELKKGIDSINNPPVRVEITAEPEPVEPPIDLVPIAECLDHIKDQIAEIKAPDTKAFAQEIVKGISKLVGALKAPEITLDPTFEMDMSPLVDALKTLQPKPIKQGAMTFKIKRNDMGHMTEVVATPGVEKPKAKEAAGTLE